MTCGQKIKWGTTPDSITTCDQEVDHPGNHQGPGLAEFPYQRVHWYEGDRRQFTGDFIECPSRGCMLPAGHPRGCAT